MRSVGILLALGVVACGHAPKEGRPIRLRGPLASLVGAAPRSLAACDSVGRTYAVRFWRAPYRACRDTVPGRAQGFEVDADTVVTAVDTRWVVPAAGRAAAFAAAEAEVARRFGPGVRCAPTRVVWRAEDSVRVALLMQVTTDVIGPGPLDSVPWTISRYARRGPLLDALWCRAGPGIPAP